MKPLEQRRIKQSAYFFAFLFLLIITFIIKLPHTIFTTSLLLGVPCASFVLTKLLLQRIEFTRKTPPSLQEGEEASVLYTLRAPSPLPLLSIATLSKKGLASQKPCIIRGGEREGEERLLALKRGRYEIKELQIFALDPLGLLKVGRRVKIEEEMLVYPSYVKTTGPLVGGGGEEGLVGAGIKGRGVEFSSTREWQKGDELRDIHWRSSARLGRLVVVERERAGGISSVIALEARPESLIGDELENSFELSIKISASLAWAVLNSGGSVRFISWQVDKVVLPQMGETAFHSLLEELSKLEATSPQPITSHLEEKVLEKGSLLIIVTSLPEESLLSNTNKYKERGILPAVILVDGSSFGVPKWEGRVWSFWEKGREFFPILVVRKGEDLKERLEVFWETLPYIY